MEEGNEIQHRLRESVRKETSDLKGFTRLMMEGKIKQALKVIDHASGVVGVHEVTDDVRTELERKHPEGKDNTSEHDVQPPVQEVIEVKKTLWN